MRPFVKERLKKQKLFKFNLYGKFEKFWPDLDRKDSIDKLAYIIRIKFA